MRSLNILLGLILLTACKQFTLSDEDQKILNRSEQLLKSTIDQTEKWTIQRIHKMNSRIGRNGSPSEDVREINLSMAVWTNYQNLVKQTIIHKEKLPPDVVNEINLYDLEIDHYDGEMKQRTSFPLKEMALYSNVQLRLELLWNLERIIDFHRARTGSCLCFDMVKLVKVHTDSEIKFYLWTKQQDQLYLKLIIPNAWKDNIECKGLPEWLVQQYQDEIISISYYDENGEIVSKKFDQLAEIQFYQ